MRKASNLTLIMSGVELTNLDHNTASAFAGS